jgi:hypothetical protein
VLNIGVPNFIKNKILDLKTQTNSNPRIVEDFIIPLSSIDKASKQKNQQRNFRIE